ncbi:MAG TPA: acetyl-CoA carboxylase biotin carboxyl carrier protein subunit [Candidatus Pelagibacter sp.]|jgi:acetyl-CoA carboxylase biotin carboxyl carrier protein|nr:acetyl-CoA carboxylase biotin carboxyl carrier protein subunit [Candidatus Pelagibacter sp.]
MKINKKIIEELVNYLKEFNLSEIEYAEGTTKVKVCRSLNNSTILSQEINDKKTNIEKTLDTTLKVTSPIVGTAYLAPEPGAKNFVEEGQKIKKGQTIMIVEAMKTMNHIPSTHEGTVSKVLVKDGDPVEFGHPLISIK